MIHPRDAVGAVTGHGWRCFDFYGRYETTICTITLDKGLIMDIWIFAEGRNASDSIF